MAERNNSETAKAEQLLVRVGGTQSGATEAVDSRLVVLQEAIAQNSAGAEQLAGRFDTHLEALNANTRALTAGSAGAAKGNSGAADTAKSIAGTILGGMTLSPLLRGLFSLFGGGSNSDNTPAPLSSYVAPTAVRVEGGVVPGRMDSVAVDRDDLGNVRPLQATQSSSQIIVNVQALDSRSFVDHSEDIARAVRRAMLESSSLNDVVSEL